MYKMISQFLLQLLLTQCILAQTDCDWVRIIYQKLGGNVSRILEDCCIMYDVTCTDGMVTEIYWSDQGLTGSIPEELSNLENLELL